MVDMLYPTQKLHADSFSLFIPTRRLQFCIRSLQDLFDFKQNILNRNYKCHRINLSDRERLGVGPRGSCIRGNKMIPHRSGVAKVSGGAGLEQ